MEKVFNVNPSGIKGLEKKELKARVNGGTHCPSYHIKDNYEGMVNNGAFLAGFIKALLNI